MNDYGCPGRGTAWWAPRGVFHENLDPAAVEAVFHKGEFSAASADRGHRRDGTALTTGWPARVDAVDVVGIAPTLRARDGLTR